MCGRVLTAAAGTALLLCPVLPRHVQNTSVVFSGTMNWPPLQLNDTSLLHGPSGGAYLLGGAAALLVASRPCKEVAFVATTAFDDNVASQGGSVGQEWSENAGGVQGLCVLSKTSHQHWI